MIHKAGQPGCFCFVVAHSHNSPGNFDHFGLEGFDVLQESRQGLAGANNALSRASKTGKQD